MKKNLPPATILITGASGVIGTALTKELSKQKDITLHSISSMDIDLTDYEKTLTFFKKIKPDIIYHLAGKVYGVMGNLKNPGKVFLDNIRINTHVIEAAREVSTRKIVAMGSVAIYSDQTQLPMSEEQIWVGHPHDSEASYAHAKRAMLAQLEAYKKQYDMDYAYCVSTNLFGPHDKFDEEFGHVIPSLISKFHRAKLYEDPIVIWGTGKPKRDFLYAKDAAYALRLIGEKYSGVINLATGNPISIYEVVEILKDITDYRGEIIWDQTKPEGQKIREYCTKKLEDIGFTPQYHLKEALGETFQWFSENFKTIRR